MMTFAELITHAEKVYAPRQIASNAWAGSVAAGILSESGNVYTGVCIDTCSGMGFCAEHAAIAAMITAGESKILKIVAIGKTGIYPPCGRCREFICQINDTNLDAEVMVSENEVVTLKELLPYRWERKE
ncbi:MAG: cytidine deaminase [Defluviitaleaceae bacterium]|nr:cytidine deaminase [Defluviitaleaceae bacterium]